MSTPLPFNASPLEIAVDETSARISDLPVPLADLWDPWQCPASHLPWLAWTFSVDAWNTAWPETVKRQVIADSLDVHRVKGTIGALKRALNALDLDAVAVSEWFETAGDPYTFDVDVELSTRGLSADEETGIRAVIEAVKNVRSHLGELRIWLKAKGSTPQVGVAMLSGQTITLYPWFACAATATGHAPVTGIGHQAVHTVTLYPQ